MPLWVDEKLLVPSTIGRITGASHASHLGCPLAYGSRVSYIKLTYDTLLP